MSNWRLVESTPAIDIDSVDNLLGILRWIGKRRCDISELACRCEQ